MNNVRDDAVELLPRLVGAAIIGAIGVVFWLGTFWLYGRLRDRLSGIGLKLVQAIFILWTVFSALILLSLVVNTLAIGPLQRAFDRVIAVVPMVFVAGLIALIAGAVLLAIIRPYRRWRTGRIASRLAIRVPAAIVFWLLISFVSFVAIGMSFDQLGLFVGPLLPILMWVAVFAGVIADLTSNRQVSVETDPAPPPPVDAWSRDRRTPVGDPHP